MLYVICDEMIPETHSHGYERPASYALLIGFLVMLVMFYCFVIEYSKTKHRRTPRKGVPACIFCRSQRFFQQYHIAKLPPALKNGMAVIFRKKFGGCARSHETRTLHKRGG